MHLPKFEHLRPSSTDEVVQLLKEYGSRVRLAAGGTDLYTRMKYGLARPEVVVSLKGLSVTPPTAHQNGDVALSAFMSLADVARSPLVSERAPLLTEAALSVGSNQIRHMGTLGGNLCLENRCSYYNQTHSYQFVEPCFKRSGDQCYLIPGSDKCWAVFQADTAPALISLGALISIKGAEGVRRLPLEKLYTGDALQPFVISDTEIVTEVIIPKQDPVKCSAFVKFSMRRGIEFAALNVAVVLDVEGSGMLCNSARITVGAVSSAPVRIAEAEEAMKGQRLSEELFHQAARIAASEVRPLPHHGYSAAYLSECLSVQCRQALESASQRIQRH